MPRHTAMVVGPHLVMWCFDNGGVPWKVLVEDPVRIVGVDPGGLHQITEWVLLNPVAVTYSAYVCAALRCCAFAARRGKRVVQGAGRGLCQRVIHKRACMPG